MSNFSKGFIRENPVFALFLGLCPALAVTNMAINGLAMGLATTFVLVGSNVVVALVRNIVPAKIRIPSYILVIASFVTVVKMVMNAYFIDLYISMGVFISLIVVNCMILGRAEGFASKNTVGKSLVDALGMGISFTISITIISIVREILGSGELTFKLSYAGQDIGTVFKFHDILKAIGLSVPGSDETATLILFVLPAGGFIVTGLLLGLFNKIKNAMPPLEEDEEDI